jgi:hypothetical protein
MHERPIVGGPPTQGGLGPRRGRPPKPARSSLRQALIALGGLFVLGFGSCVVCVALVGKAGREGSHPAVVDAGRPRAEAPFVTALVQLVANPKSIKPSDTTGDQGIGKPGKKDKNLNYEYTNPPGIPIPSLFLTVQKTDSSAWEFGFEEREMLDDGGLGPALVSKEDFAPSDGLSKLPDPHPSVEGFEQYEITGGTLKGTFLQREGGRIEVMSLPYAIAEGIRWVCENRFPGARPWSAFEDQCRDIARQKLLVPSSADFPGLFDGTQEQRTGKTMPGCGWAWDAWVDSTNALNVKIRHAFHCEDDPKTHAVTFKMD